MSDYTILWVDDNKKRREGNRGGIGSSSELEIIPVDPTDVAEALIGKGESEKIGGLTREPDLALVDWVLHKGDFGGDGPSIEGMLHGRYPDLPIYSFSGQASSREIKRQRQRSQDRFDLFTTPERLNEEALLLDLHDYDEIREAKGQGKEGLLQVLDAEEIDREKLISTIPTEFSDGIPGTANGLDGSTLRFARWVRTAFLQTPGLLWDKVWTATKVGIDHEKFGEYADSFDEALYNGIFSHREQRWWREKVKDTIYTLAEDQEDSVSRTWTTGPKLLGISDANKSTCTIGCQYEHPPETVAAGEADEPAKFPVHYNCSYIERSREATFEDYRLMERR